MAGFEVTLYGRFWVTPEAEPHKNLLISRLSAHFEHTRRLEASLYSCPQPRVARRSPVPSQHPSPYHYLRESFFLREDGCS